MSVFADGIELEKEEKQKVKENDALNTKINSLEKRTKKHFTRVHTDISEIHDDINNLNTRVDIAEENMTNNVDTLLKDIYELDDKYEKEIDDVYNTLTDNIQDIQYIIDSHEHHTKISFIICYILTIIAIILGIVAIYK